MGKLEGRAALVSGAGRGVGRATALKLAAEGASVVVNDLDAGPAADTVEKITSAGGQAIAVPGSVTANGFADRFIGAAVESFGGVDIIINNAGYTWDNVVQKMSDEQWDAIVDLHLKAPFQILRAAQPIIRAAVQREAERGIVVHRKVVNVSSVSGIRGNSGQANYSSAKAGLFGLTKTLAKEWGRYHVNVNCVAFGFIETRLSQPIAEGGSTIEVEGREIKVGVPAQAYEAIKMIVPLGRAGSPEEAAGSVVMLTYPEADYVSGQVLVAGGGYEG
ncbi:SDR family NAD(P)-dependent oxidoreductase [Dactylosporangium sucinum]|uniref:3-oxoacyl-ACP reductase n=1 Tax=Dactylosporangium sucinum TaxID=1424081 RepID=A0A917UFV8_9ACTN|nr:SDR family oxidoreductase [Dactylosporangium sucinum]GGM89828.1 3-oxoacyl-ACP reductase [Dactylosporangium sucinum]